MRVALSLLFLLPFALSRPSRRQADNQSAEDWASISTKTWNPPSDLANALSQTWQHEMDTYSDPLGFKNYGYDQLMATNGSINYCVRWESTASVTAAQRATIETALQRSYEKWMSWLYGYDNFPFSKVNVKVVGWAVSDKSLLQGDTSGITVYTDKDSGGAPECAEACGRFFHQDNNYSGCSGGTAKHYDQSLWLTSGFEGGAGGDWGQRVSSEYFLETMNDENVHIVLHEMGHTFALDDFYDWTPPGVTNFVMLAGSATEVTPFDAWMMRNWWTQLKSRYGISSSTSTTKASSTTTKATTTTTKPATTTSTTSSPTGSAAAHYAQCGGQGWTGATTCVSPYVCTKQNDYYSQCL